MSSADKVRGAGDTPIDEDARRCNLSALNVAIHPSDISGLRPESTCAITWNARHKSLSFRKISFVTLARDDSLGSLARSSRETFVCALVQERAADWLAVKSRPLSTTLSRVIAPSRGGDAEKMRIAERASLSFLTLAASR